MNRMKNSIELQWVRQMKKQRQTIYVFSASTADYWKSASFVKINPVKLHDLANRCGTRGDRCLIKWSRGSPGGHGLWTVHVYTIQYNVGDYSNTARMYSVHTCCVSSQLSSLETQPSSRIHQGCLIAKFKTRPLVESAKSFVIIL